MMNKKILIQFILILTMILITFAVFLKYIYKGDDKKNFLNKEKKTESIIKQSTSNLIKDLKYLSSDEKGNKYEIKAIEGIIDFDNQDIVFMTDVTAQIKFNGSEPVDITSDYAKYNSKTYETDFTENIVVTYVGHRATSEFMNINLETNLAIMIDNIVYNNHNTVLRSDKLEIDLISKNSKIFMKNNANKVEVITLN